MRKAALLVSSSLLAFCALACAPEEPASQGMTHAASEKLPADPEPEAVTNTSRDGGAPRGATGKADAGGVGGSGDGVAAGRNDLGEGDGSDVVAIGDSYMRLPNRATQGPGNEGVDLSLQKISGRPYRTFAFVGGRVFPPVAVAIQNGVIPNQFAMAKQQGDVKTVLATGGGNDLPQGGGPCKGATSADQISADCRTLVDGINEAIDEFVADMAAQGVKDLVWVGYGPTDPSKGLEGAIAALRSGRKAKCVADNPALGLRCHYIDNFAAKIPTRDGFHPTPEGYNTIAAAVFERMKTERMRR